MAGAPWSPWRPTRPTPAQLAAAAAVIDARPGAVERWNEFYRVKPPSEPRTTKTGRASNRRRGTAIEGEYGGRGVAAVLRDEGYGCFPAAGSFGPADRVGRRLRADAGPPIRAVQAKRSKTFLTAPVCDAVGAFLGLGQHRRPWPLLDGTREVWLWVDAEGGWVARVLIQPDDAMRVSGPRRQEVYTRLTTWLRDERAKRRQQASNVEETNEQWQIRKGLR